jgi:hypothetical protein
VSQTLDLFEYFDPNRSGMALRRFLQPYGVSYPVLEVGVGGGGSRTAAALQLLAQRNKGTKRLSQLSWRRVLHKIAYLATIPSSSYLSLLLLLQTPRSQFQKIRLRSHVITLSSYRAECSMARRWRHNSCHCHGYRFERHVSA